MTTAKMKILENLIVLFACACICKAEYTLQVNYSGTDFFQGWNFYTQNDPTNGYVNYVNYQEAKNDGLISASPDKVIIAADSQNIASGRGRNSVRIQTIHAWDNGLFILDLVNMPSGCGTWPAWWLVGPNWPNSGEIDIIEGVNAQTFVDTTLHTSNGCTQSSSNSMFTGKWNLGTNGQPATNCYINAPNQANNQGCGIAGLDGSYGTPFNAGGGGVYATEWTDSHIQMFFFSRGNIPKDITADMPDPTTWGKPYAYFELGNDCPASKFNNMSMIFDLTFCGDWDGAVFEAQCPNKGTCQSFVQNNPKDFATAYWQINYLKVFVD